LYICDIYRFLSIFKKFAIAKFCRQATATTEQPNNQTSNNQTPNTSKHFYLGHISRGTSLVTSPAREQIVGDFCLGAGIPSQTFFSAKVLKALINLWHLMSACNELIVSHCFAASERLNVSDSWALCWSCFWLSYISLSIT